MVVTAKFKVIDWGVVVAEIKYLRNTYGIDVKLIANSPQDVARIYSEISKIDQAVLREGIKEHVYKSAHLDKYVPENRDKILIMGANQKRYAVWYANSFI